MTSISTTQQSTLLPPHFLLSSLPLCRSLKISPEKRGPSYPAYLPTWDRSLHYDPYIPIDNPPQPALAADPKKPNLLHQGTKVVQLTPHFGTEVHGVQISRLTDAGKNELALLVAERGVVVFRDQDFVELGPEGLVEYGKYFGELHVHPVSGHPAGYPELHIVYRGPEEAYPPIPNPHNARTGVDEIEIVDLVREGGYPASPL